jgi:hypothetical protein
MARNFAAHGRRNEDGTVTQHFQQHNAETGEWSDWFIGIYTKKIKPNKALLHQRP